MAESAKTAQKQFELENAIEPVSDDFLYKYDEAAQRAILSAKPWTKDVKYFKNVKMSAIALLKIIIHARSAPSGPLGQQEIMGVMTGRIDGQTMIVSDAFALPVEGTETRVNPGNEAMEYMVQFRESSGQVGRSENIVGWYHSHPGYRPFLSGLDCETQMTNQKYQDPFLAVVVDPVQTAVSGKVDIGAFRTYPEGHKAAPTDGDDEESIPLEKTEDYGVHRDKYYRLPMTFFKSSLDTQLLELLWKGFWIDVLSTSPLVTNRQYLIKQLTDVANKMEKAESEISRSSISRASMFGGGGSGSDEKEKKEISQLGKIARDSVKMTSEEVRGVMSEVIKDALFNLKTTRGAAPCGCHGH